MAAYVLYNVWRWLSSPPRFIAHLYGLMSALTRIAPRTAQYSIVVEYDSTCEIM
jgi:hypothetical protein